MNDLAVLSLRSLFVGAGAPLGWKPPHRFGELAPLLFYPFLWVFSVLCLSPNSLVLAVLTFLMFELCFLGD